MSVYTRPEPSENEINWASAPGLIFQKWQAWDGENNQFKLANGKLVRTDSRLPYLQKIAGAVQDVYQNNYPAWRGRYLAALETLGVDASIQYKTVWRLLVGWGSNPTLEAGMTLHHLYGFPYIPGAAVKGLLHHAAEMEVMSWEVEAGGDQKQTVAEAFPRLLAGELPSEPPAWLSKIMLHLQLIKTLFGSIHLERAKVKKEKKTKAVGPLCPKPLLNDLMEKISPTGPAAWKKMRDEIKKLLDENTGGMLCFYDAVPATEQNELLQTDIVNCHYNDYYGSEGDTPPSDDQNSNPVTFLAVRPGAKFIFPFRLADWPVAPGRDKEEKERLQVLHDLTRQSVIVQVKTWLQTALGECGVGAKTAAGYGYFDTGAIAPPATNALPMAPTLPPEAVIIAVAPPPFHSNIAPAAKISGIGKNHNPALWQKLAANDYIEKIDGKSPSLKAFGMALPGWQISPNGRTMQVFYQNEKFYCEVTLKLQGTQNPGHAQHLWENVILPELSK